MCGFAGFHFHSAIAGPQELRQRLAAMAAAIAHRGPDAESMVVEPHAAVVFRRLAIVDLVTGDQPVHGTDPRVQVFFNGEIYNHLELRQRLRTEHGVVIDHGSDAAVLPHLYECYGEDFVQLCNGMFAICVLDGRDRSCRLYRDRLGIKPLYYAATDDAVVFGSELKPLLASGLVEPRLDPGQVVPFLELFYVPGRQTMLAGIEKLLPGERLLLRPGAAPRRERWWQLSARRAQRPDDALDELDALLADATRLQLMADVPLGVSLSGGIDSSLIAHYARRGDSACRAFTIAFPATDPGELDCARQVARHLGIEQVELTATTGDFFAELDRTTVFNDEPVADPAFYPALLVARAAAEHVKVLLAGSGADELFAGYGHYQLSLRNRCYRSLALLVGDRAAAVLTRQRSSPEERRALREYGHDRVRWHAAAMTHLSPFDRQELRPLVQRDAIEEIVERFRAAAWLDPMNQQLCVDAETYLPHQLLNLLDRTTMGASIEGRVPFLDHRVAEFALTVHGRHKFAGRRGNKILLRRLAARHLPPEVATRRKHGFPSDVYQWFGAAQLPQLRERLLGGGTFAREFFPRRWLDHLLASPAVLQANAYTVHSVTVLDAWYRTFVSPGSWRADRSLAARPVAP